MMVIAKSDVLIISFLKGWVKTPVPFTLYGLRDKETK